MSTRGSFILRKHEVDKELYIPSDAYPDWAGRRIVNLIKTTNLNTLNDLLYPGEDGSEFSADACEDAVGNMSPYEYRQMGNPFIADSIMCEYAYAIDLDRKKLEYYIGWQKTPQEGNRYGTEPQKSASGEEFYPCRLVASFTFAYIRATETAAIVRQMKQYKRNAPADIEVFEMPAIVLKTGGDADSGEKAPESPDRQILGSIKALLLFDPLGLEITGALTNLYAAPEDAIRDVIKRLTLSD